MLVGPSNECEDLGYIESVLFNNGVNEIRVQTNQCFVDEKVTGSTGAFCAY